MIALLTPLSVLKGAILKPETIILHAKVLPTAQPSPTPVLELQEASASGETVKVVEPTKKPTHDKEHIEYLKTIFGNEWKIAFAVAQNECNSNRKNWPGSCVLSTEKEHSVGWFQINLAQGHGDGAWIHAAKVPGKTIADKEEWLMEPKNNILMAKIIKDRSGWEAWSAYTSGNYKKDL